MIKETMRASAATAADWSTSKLVHHRAGQVARSLRACAAKRGHRAPDVVPGPGRPPQGRSPDLSGNYACSLRISVNRFISSSRASSNSVPAWFSRSARRIRFAFG